jgi:hypothetical protein
MVWSVHRAGDGMGLCNHARSLQRWRLSSGRHGHSVGLTRQPWGRMGVLLKAMVLGVLRLMRQGRSRRYIPARIVRLHISLLTNR